MSTGGVGYRLPGQQASDLFRASRTDQVYDICHRAFLPLALVHREMVIGKAGNLRQVSDDEGLPGTGQ